MSDACGFFISDKPSGVTSFSMVALVRRLTGVRRVGHAGTLDPLASGVLPVAVGPATRLIEYMDTATKVYVAWVRFGVTTDTYDAEGKVVAEGDASVATAEAVASLVPELIGDVEQTPPAFSAIKVAGKPLYRYAREGADVRRAPRTVRIDAITVRSVADGVAELEVRCGPGTYIRSLAHDLGQRLGCGAHLAALRRTSSSGFDIEDATEPDTLVDAAAAGRLDGLMLAPDRAVEREAAAVLGEPAVRDLRDGRDLRLEARREPLLCRAYSLEGEFLAILRTRGGGLWHPEKVLPTG
jgi:tRNA pseudouridine55 synthase